MAPFVDSGVDYVSTVMALLSIVSAVMAFGSMRNARQQADRANSEAERANTIQAEMAERDRLRYEREEAQLREVPVVLLLVDEELSLTSNDKAALSKVLVRIEDICLELDGQVLLTYREAFPNSRAAVDNYGSLARNAARAVHASTGRLRRGAAGLIQVAAQNGFAKQLIYEPLTIRVNVVVEYVFSTIPRHGRSRYNVRASVQFGTPADESLIHVNEARMASRDFSLSEQALKIASVMPVFDDPIAVSAT